MKEAADSPSRLPLKAPKGKLFDYAKDNNQEKFHETVKKETSPLYF